MAAKEVTVRSSEGFWWQCAKEQGEREDIQAAPSRLVLLLRRQAAGQQHVLQAGVQLRTGLLHKEADGQLGSRGHSTTVPALSSFPRSDAAHCDCRR